MERIKQHLIGLYSTLQAIDQLSFNNSNDILTIDISYKKTI